jgi:hypothetical protein
MKSACPPAALSVWIGAELEQHVDHVDVFAGYGNQRRRIESEDGSVDVRANVFRLFEQLTHGLRVAAFDGAFESLEWRKLVCGFLRDSTRQLAPTRESIFARQHELRVGEREFGLVGQFGAHASDGIAIAGAKRAQEFLGERLLLLDVRTCGKGTAKRGRHSGLLR